MSMTNQAIERLKGLVKKWRELAGNSTLSRACVLRGCASELEADLESALGEPSDELPMVGCDGLLRLQAREDGCFEVHQEWRIERNVHLRTFTTRAAAEAFLLECAAQQASEPQQAGERASDDCEPPDQRCQCAECDQEAVGFDEGTPFCAEHYRRRPAPAAPQEPTKLDWLRKRCADFTTAWGQCAKAADCSSDRKATLVTCSWQLQEALKELMAAEMAEAKNAAPQAEPTTEDR